jgi:hypothetical protein
MFDGHIKPFPCESIKYYMKEDPITVVKITPHKKRIGNYLCHIFLFILIMTYILRVKVK